MKIHHEPKFDIEKVIEHYSQKDGVPIRYVATTELEVDNLVGDVFYREHRIRNLGIGISAYITPPIR